MTRKVRAPRPLSMFEMLTPHARPDRARPPAILASPSYQPLPPHAQPITACCSACLVPLLRSFPCCIKNVVPVCRRRYPLFGDSCSRFGRCVHSLPALVRAVVSIPAALPLPPLYTSASCLHVCPPTHSHLPAQIVLPVPAPRTWRAQDVHTPWVHMRARGAAVGGP